MALRLRGQGSSSDRGPAGSKDATPAVGLMGTCDYLGPSITSPNPLPSAQLPRFRHAGAIGGLTAAATFVFGIAVFVSSLSDYTTGDPTPAESVAFLLDRQTTFYAWYLVIFIVFGVAIIPLGWELRTRLVDVQPLLVDVAAVFAYGWAGLMFATGMISNLSLIHI